MIELLYKNWKDVSIALYNQIAEISEDKELGDAEKEIAIISLLCGVEEDDVWNLPLGEIQRLRDECGWLNRFNFDKAVKYKKVVIGKYKCKFHMNLEKMTYSQYVDFQNAWNADKRNLSRLIACFFVPEGCTYGDGYDMAEFIETIENNLSIVTANEICFFILTSLAHSTKVSLKSLENKMKWTMRLTKMSKPVRTQMEIMRKSVKDLISMIG